MPNKPLRIYWDACCFLAILNKEPEASKCIDILNEAKAGLIEIWISPLTMAETVRPKGSPSPLAEVHRHAVLDFFDNDYIKFIQIGMEISRDSLSICWEHNIHARDAIHLASARAAGCEYLESKDGAFIERVANCKDISVRRPTGRGDLPLLESTENTP